MKKIKDFRVAQHNTNLHTQRGLGALDKSIRTDGWIGAMTTAADGEMIAGSARLERVADVFGVEVEPLVIKTTGQQPIVIVRTDIPNASDPRAQRLSLADNRIAQLDLSWSVEVIAGMSPEIIEGLWSPEELSTLGQQWADEQGAGGQDEQYSRKIESPVYEPKNPKPAVSELFDDTKTRTLLAAIEAAAELTDEERAFLTIAARRHTVIHYNKVADFYAHADAKLQALMEDSALVIIDFNRAIELGYVKLAEDIAKLYGEEYGAT
jgi:hypothetical protein